MKRALLIAIGLAASAHVITRGADQLASGRNVNVHPGIADQYVGDIYLQRKVEPKVVCSSTNTLHCLAIANDYRLTDPQADVQSGFGETAKLHDPSRPLPSRMAAGSDAWLGLYRTSNQENWLNGMVPGFPSDNSALGMQQPWAGLGAATDGGLATDGVHFYGVGLFFNRGSYGVVGAFRLTDYNDESKWPIRWDASYSRFIDSNNSVTVKGQFADLPSILGDPFREGSPGGGKSECKSHVYIGYTIFSGAPTNNSFIKFVRSLDCGDTYSKPITLQGSQFKSNQRVVLAVDPRPGTPKTTGGGTLYAVWRSFSPDQIVFVKSIDFGATWSNPTAITALSGPANLCTYDQPTVGRIDTSNPADETARALAFASAQVDNNGKLHVVWTERVDPSGNALQTASCTKTAQPKIVITSSSNGGNSFTPRRALDFGLRCEAGGGTATGPRDVPPLQNGCPAGATPRDSGPQIHPSLSHNAGKMVVLYSEGRGGLNTTLPTTSPSYGYFTGRNSRMDVRAAQIDPTNDALISTTQVSQYTILAASGQIKGRDGATNPAGSKAVSLFFLPQYKGGTVPFKGDHDDITPGETFIWESPAHWATALDVRSARFFAIWGGDTRESRFPGGDLFATNGWSDYQGVGSPSAPACNAGIRLSNDYFAYVGSDLEAVVHQSFKPLDGLQRTWSVTLRNRGFAMKSVTLSLVKKPDVRVEFASFDQFGQAELTSISVPRLILPHSSFTFTVFGKGNDPNGDIAAPIKVLVDDQSTPAPIDAIVRLNPNPVNPAPLVGAAIATSEHHGSSVLGPYVHSYAWAPTPGNPTPGNPTPGNPTPGNPTPGNPTPGNVTAVPTPGNPTAGATGFSDYTDYQYVVAGQDANTLSAYSTFGNMPVDVDDSHIVQMFITRVATVPTLKDDCSGLAERQDGQLLSIINANSVADLGVPTPGSPTPGNPTPGNPTLLTPTPGNPTPGNPTPGNTTMGNNTFALTPANTPQTAGLPSTYRATAIASAVPTAVSALATALASDGTAVASPGADYAIVTFRFYHCRVGGQCRDGVDAKQAEVNEKVPTSCASQPDGTCAVNDPASSLIGFTTIPVAGDNNCVNNICTITPPQPVTRGPDLTISTAPSATPPNGVAGDVTTIGAFTITNAGSRASGPSSYKYFLMPSGGGASIPLCVNNFEGPPSCGSIPIEGIAAGGTLAIPEQTGVIIPTGTSPGTYLIGPMVDDANNVGETNEFNNFAGTTFTVVPPLIITTTTLNDASNETQYSQTLSASGGFTPYSWSIVPGSGYLPPGLSLNSSTGEISGMPTGCATTYRFTAQVNDSRGHYDTQSLSITMTGTACIAVWADGQTDAGGNGIVGFINAMPGFSASLVTTADLETTGFLSGFSALYVTRADQGFGTGLSLAAATKVQAFVGGGPVVLFLNDWNDNLPQSNVGDAVDAKTSQLIQNAIMLAASGHGYVGEFNGAVMGLTANANSYPALGFISGSAAVADGSSGVTCSPVTITAAGSVIQGNVPTNFTPTDNSCFSFLATGVAGGNIWATYNTLGGRPAVVGRQ